MQRDVRAYLWDVREAAVAINDFVQGVDLAAYVATPMLHSAVERKFEVIGEALNQLAKLDMELASRIPELSNIIAFRNLLIHGYALIDHARVWRTIHESLPPLVATVTTLLGELDAQRQEGT